MKQDLILAGVGGQGILTIAHAVSLAALKRGLKVKQAEVHGMAQRGGGVQSHIRISDSEIHSDLIPAGRADLLVAVEPLESLRYIHYLGSAGAVVSSLNIFVNIPNYPPVESVLERIAAHPRHVLIDADRIARAAGSGRSANIAALGAASLFLDIEPNELEEAIAEMFAAKGPKVVEVNHRAFRFGRNAGRAYLDGLQRGASSVAVRHWIESLGPEHLAEPERPDAPVLDVVSVENRLSGAEAHAVERILTDAYEEGRRQLFEHEIYSVVQMVGAISPPYHVFLSTEELISEEDLARFPGDQVVLKIVSPDIVHKTEARGIAFVPKRIDTVRAEIDRLIARHRPNADVRGVLVVENVERVRPGLGNELFVGIRATREFGPVIAAGLGGIDTEYLAKKMQPGLAVAKAAATDLTAEAFLDLFRGTAAYEILSGKARGRVRMVSDGELLRCFRAFILLAQHFCVDRGEEGPDVAELEVNPFAFRQQRLVPLDGRGRLAPATKAVPGRPPEKVDRLLEPGAIAVLGVSSASMNVGRMILNNLIECGFPRDLTWIVKAGEKEIDGVACVPSVAELPRRVGLLVIAAPAKDLPAIVRETAASRKVDAAIMIPGGAGETEGSAGIAKEVRAAIAEGRALTGDGPVFMGPNSLGAISKPGRYDTLFIPSSRLDKRWTAPARRVALVSQSGAFIVSRMSNLETLDPAFAISLGNQFDLSTSDLVAALGRRDDVDTIGVYAEGFNDLDGLALLRNITAATAAGKCVVFYKAGRTASGRSAAASHTASVAGDYDVCQAAAAQAGALVADTFKEFEQMLELSAAFHGKKTAGVRVGAVSNAGFEAVGMADAIQGQRYTIEMSALSEDSIQRLGSVLKAHGLERLVTARNPLDLTPMATEEAYESAIRVLMSSPEVDAIVVGVVPLTAALKTTAGEISKEGSLARRLPRLLAESAKPLLAVVDSGPRYDPLIRALRLGGVPVLPSADQAIRSLGRYL
ncbi:MAG TPA: indolepyruvate oxidoreductase subunit beta, partial [Candidatus Saccharimonadales bacterium]|nr:indolepyruvate oxidoreductase subunit beta [Candidatus Saccharimonadales bacterium]